MGTGVSLAPWAPIQTPKLEASNGVHVTDYKKLHGL